MRTIASPQLRATATVADNLVQAKRCWFFRNGFDCYKHGGVTCPCYAVTGNHRFHHAVVGGRRCQAVTPSDLGTALLALDAEIEIAGPKGSRRVLVGDFYTGPGETCLRHGEVVLAVHLPDGALDRSLVTRKLALWEGDFAVASVVLSWVPVEAGPASDVRLVLGAVAPTPFRAGKTEAVLTGRHVTGEEVERLLRQELRAVAHPLPRNAWKLEAVVGLAAQAGERAEQVSVQFP